MGELVVIPLSDYGQPLGFTCKDADGNAIDITDYTVTFKMWVPGSSGTLLVDDVCTKDAPAEGTCHWTITDSFNTLTVYMAELELTKEGVKMSSDLFKVRGRESG